MKETWVGNRQRFGAVQRLGVAFQIISLGLVALTFVTSGTASIIYWIFVTAHLSLYLGFVIAALADVIAGRPFSSGRLAYAVLMGLFYGVLGPIMMAAAFAAGMRR